jgi:hypothetical protein
MGLRGKVDYLDMIGLTWLDLKHQGVDGDMSILGANGLASKGEGDTVTLEWLKQQICDGEDVEMGFLYTGGGGHRVELIGICTILGVPFALHLSDSLQSDVDPNNTMGTDTVDITPLIDTDGDGLLNVVYGKADANVHSAFSQSIPEPATVALLAAAGLLIRRRSWHA